MGDNDLINRLEKAQERQAEEMAKLTSCIAELVTVQKLIQQDTNYIKEFHNEVKEHIKIAKPILLRSDMWHKRLESWITRYLPAIAILAVIGATYKGYFS
jgi:hypothetical protein